MVHKYLVSRGLARILCGLILVLLGFVVFINLMTQPIISRFHLPEQVVALLLEAKARQGAIIGAIGSIFLIFGSVFTGNSYFRI